jgi:hypothetical protein
MRRLATYLFVFCLVGCHAGHDFPTPTPENLVLGQSMRAEILRTYGRPTRESSAILSSTQTEAVTKGEFDMTPVSGAFASLVYVYADRTGTVLVGAVSSVKAATFDFWNDTLIGYNFVSTFKDDAPNFDESKIAEIRKAQSTKAEVVQLFGPPSGRAVYPEVQHQGNEKYIYSYLRIGRRERLTKRLEILFGTDGVVLDYRFASDNAPVIGPATTTTATPIFIPQTHR